MFKLIPNNITKKSSPKLVFFMLSLFLLVSCNNDTNNSSTTNVDTKKEETVVEVVPFEDLDDPEFYKYPRLQFTMQSVRDESDSVWSMKLDGTDLRRAIHPKKMFPAKPGGFMRKPIRSPNRRYLLYVGNRALNIFDFKTSETIKITSSPTSSNFGWSKDSNMIFFYGQHELFRYTLSTKKTVKLEKYFWAKEMFTMNDGKTLGAVQKNGVAFYDYDGNLIKKIELGIKDYWKTRITITPDGRFFFIDDTEPAKIFDLTNPPNQFIELKFKEKILAFYADDPYLQKKLKFRESIFSGPMILGPKAKFLYNRYSGEIVRYSVDSGEMTTIFTGKGVTYPNNYSLMH
ncbi:hypothetical protein MNBD_GAMMA22-2049 [hydrothermal vent metagenome]|uniref:Lipoprotein n=1 Tax=hydrothermal vent metagenome TaxID=652676 RepID=A0A3B1ATW2_9ZZZZ